MFMNCTSDNRFYMVSLYNTGNLELKLISVSNLWFIK